MKKHGSMKTKKNILLAVTALILTMLMAVGVTYSWIEDVKLVEISTVENAENTPLKAGVDINSDVSIEGSLTVDENNTTVNLGNILTSNDLKDSSGNIKSGYSPNVSGETLPADINKKKGYFYESGDMHLSPCYSDGIAFYFPVRGANGNVATSGTTYRLGNKNDENVNYIDFTFNVSSPVANTAFWFEEIPTIKSGNTVIPNARFALTVDGNTKVFSSSGSDVHSVNSVTSTQTKSIYAESLAKYTYGNADNTSSAGGQNSNVLFSIEKGKTKTVNVKIWVEGGISDSIATSDINMTICSSLGKTRKIKLVDKTTNTESGAWIHTDGAQLYLAIPDLYNGSWTEGTNYFHFTNSNNEWSVTIPLAYNNYSAIIYRCRNSWNGHESNTDGTVQVPRNESYKVWAWNYWTSTLPDTFKDETYTVYGSTYDKNAAQVLFNDNSSNPNSAHCATFLGYGTWGSTIQIKIKSDGNTNYITHISNSTNLIIADYSDYDKTNRVYFHTMNYSNNTWNAWVPESSTKIRFFYYHHGDNVAYNAHWGYSKGADSNSKERPIGSSSLTFHITGTGYENYPYQETGSGPGYWEGSGEVYFVGTPSSDGTNMWSNNTPRIYVFNSASDHGTAWPGDEMTEDGRTVTVNGTSYNVFKKSNVDSKYAKVIFNNGNSGDGNQSADETLYIGKYYNWNDGEWYDSLESIAGGSSSGGGGGTSGELTENPDGAGWYLYGKLDSETKYKWLKLATGNSGVIHLDKANSGTYYFFLAKVASNGSWIEYGGSGSKTLNGSSTNESYNMSKNTSSTLGLTVNQAAYYKFKYTELNSDTASIQITYDHT